jgi:hypothetical protein
MAALKMGFTRKLWWGLSVTPYALRNESDSSVPGDARFWLRAMQVNSRPLGEHNRGQQHLLLLSFRDVVPAAYRVNQRRPSVALWDLVLSSLTTSSWRVCDSSGAAS